MASPGRKRSSSRRPAARKRREPSGIAARTQSTGPLRLHEEKQAALERSRERLLDAVTWAAARYGYAGASVARIIDHARLSRATFYQHFSGREEAFQAAYHRAVKQAAAAVETVPPFPRATERALAVLEVLFELVAADPAAARLLLIEALAAGPAVREEQERTIAAAEGAIGRILAHAAAEEEMVPQIPITALLGGLAGVVSTQVFAHHATNAPHLLGDLSSWLDSYAVPARMRMGDADWLELGRGLAPPPPPPSNEAVQLLPRGRGALPPAELGALQRRRIIDAVARLVAERGYAEMTVSDVLALARISRRAFYSHFPSKQDAFLAAQTVGLQEGIGAAAAAFFTECDWPEQVWSAAAAMLGYVARHPDLAHLAIVETNAAGDAAILRQHDSRTAFTVFLEHGYRRCELPNRPPRLASDAIAWAIFALMRRQVLAGRTAQMSEILPEATYTILAPFIGPRSAIDFIVAKCEWARRERQAAL